ncbi:DAYSLEEPER [Hibiscus trionum]|uniref:DAYSLEEPER n=1 Tax=Hibiscus trionum TaxID=183268 RepID=A0A9W7M4M3_HIBTR|nr:DAYSLEEPER [Hibiscus trionum]
MSDVSCNGLSPFNDGQYLDSYSPFESTKLELSANNPTMEDTQNPEAIRIIACDKEVDATSVAVSASAEQVDAANNEESTPFTKNKRKKTSGV